MLNRTWSRIKIRLWLSRNCFILRARWGEHVSRTQMSSLFSLVPPHQPQVYSNVPDPLPLVSRVFSLSEVWFRNFLIALCIKRVNASIKPAIKITQTNDYRITCPISKVLVWEQNVVVGFVFIFFNTVKAPVGHECGISSHFIIYAP